MSFNLKDTFDIVKRGVIEHAPEILVGLGCASVIAGVVFTSKATLKIAEKKQELKDELEATVDQAKADMQEIDEGLENEVELKDDTKYSKTDAAKDKAIVYKRTFKNVVKTGATVAKEYVPGVGFLVTGLALILWSHKILRDRNAALLTAYSALDTAFKVYRSRVIADGGKEADAKYLYGTKTEVTEKKVVNPETGLEETVMESKEVIDYPLGSPYARIFDETNPIYEKSDSGNVWNRNHLKRLEEFANEKLDRVGYVYLNDVYQMLGYEETEIGHHVGWRKNGNGDGKISFGIDLTYTDPRFKDFIDRDRMERIIVLDFNVDGVIDDKVYNVDTRNNGLGFNQMCKIQKALADAEAGRAEHDSVYERMDEEAWAIQNK